MKISVHRVEADAESTLGKLFIDGVFACWTLEDQAQPGGKVRGETRIPEGVYRLRQRKIGESRFDPSYSKRFPDMHKGMIEICDVPNFLGVLIHVGNFETETEGCLLVGLERGRDPRGHLCVLRSVPAYMKIYPRIIAALARGEDVTLTILDRTKGGAQ